jgi:hypothetical protein
MLNYLDSNETVNEAECLVLAEFGLDKLSERSRAAEVKLFPLVLANVVALDALDEQSEAKPDLSPNHITPPPWCRCIAQPAVCETT